MKQENCPCGRENTFENCCELIHNDMSIAITAEDLMRSRFSGFVKANGDYLMQSYHSTTRPIKEKNAIVTWAKSVQWIGLEVLNTTKGTETDTEGTVEFKAYYQEGLQKECIHENSRFVRENGNWIYLGVV